jgi:hypothetical protein
MNFVADESVDRLIVERLRREGYQVSYVAELEPGMLDEAVLNLANQETALLLTADKDFGEMVIVSVSTCMEWCCFVWQA